MKKMCEKSKECKRKFKDVVENSKINCNFQRFCEKFKDFAKHSKNSLNFKTSLNFRKNLLNFSGMTYEEHKKL